MNQSTILSGKKWKKATCPWCSKICVQATFNDRMFYCFRVAKVIFEGKPQMSLQKGQEGKNFLQKGLSPSKSKSAQLTLNFGANENSPYDIEP